MARALFNNTYGFHDTPYNAERRVTLHSHNERGIVRANRRTPLYTTDSSDDCCELSRVFLTPVTVGWHFALVPIDKGLEDCKDAVRRSHRDADRINAKLDAGAVLAEIHPKPQRDGRYPRDFQQPMPVGRFRTLSDSAIGRLLVAYDILDERFQPVQTCCHNPEISRGKKLSRLYEFLGAKSLVDFYNPERSSNERYVTWC